MNIQENPMSRFDLAKVCLGVALMAYFGSSIAQALFPADAPARAAVAGFAFGIAVFAQMGAFTLRARVAELERRLASAEVDARPAD
jgi:hypothetical protein